MRGLLLIVLLSAGVATSGCLTGGTAGTTTLNGLDGDVVVEGRDGVAVAEAGDHVAIGIARDPPLQGNVTLNASDGRFVFTRADGSDGSLSFNESLGGFETSAGLAAGGPLVARVHVGTAQSVTVQNQTRNIVTAATEGTEATVFLRGSGQLVNGTAVILFPAEFRLLIGEGPLTVQLTPTSANISLYLEQKAPDGFVVGSNGGGDGTFDFFAQATRAGTAGFVSVR